MHHKLDLGQNSLPGAQQYTTVEPAAAIKAQDKFMKVQDKEDIPKVLMSNNNGQNKREIYRRAEYTIPQLDGTYNVSDSSDIDLHDYLDLANTDITQYNTRGQKRDKRCKVLYLAFIWGCFKCFLLLLQLCQRSLFLWLCINIYLVALGNVVRVYPRIVQGLTFLSA